MLSKINKTFRYLMTVAFTLIIGVNAILASPPNWTVNPAEYQYNMPGIFRVMKANNIFMNEVGAMVGVFVGNETRGVVNANDIIFIGDDAYFPATMYSNQQIGEVLTFKVYVPSLDSIFVPTETAIFNRFLTMGTPPNPFILNISMCDALLILNTDFSPLSGVYKAGQEIRLEGNVNLSSGMNLILDAPVVKSNGIFNLGQGATLTIYKDGCD